STWAAVTIAPADAADQPRSLISHTSVNVHTTTWGATSRHDTAWMRHNTDDPRYGLARSAASANPYRGSSVLWRIHAVSCLLVAPQVVVWTFTLVWLMSDRGWSAASAGAMVTAAQVLGAGGRIAAGRWSDIVGSRLRPIRTIALAAAATMGLLALTDWLDSPVSVALMVMASIITVSDNGLAFTAIAEIAGPFWSGRALGTQNTSQLLTAG